MRRIGPRSAFVAGAVALGSLAFMSARAPLGSAAPTPLETEGAMRVRLGREAVKAGKTDAARRHFLDAIAIEPGLVAGWCELATLDGSDADARSLWALDAAFATAPATPDPTGKPLKALLVTPFVAADLATPSDLVAKRAALAKAIADLGAKLFAGGNSGGTLVISKWLAVLAEEAGSGAPTLSAAARASADKAAARCRPDSTRLRTSLAAAIAEAKAAGNAARAVEASRLLLGFASQRRGAGPNSRAPMNEALTAHFALSEAREALRAKAAAPIPFSDLLSPSRGREFEDAYAGWADPIVATSMKGHYRIESVCGIDTTREAAELVELCHDRLVEWCGKDPFDGRQGVVRLCPSPAELEAEGSPQWWAHGFCSGDTVTVLVQWATADDLAQSLAHELTHRFDGALLPGLPAWAAEGRANYVEAATTARRPSLDGTAIDVGQLEAAYQVIGGWPESLADIIAGKDPEYRHNYPVGYAVWFFLSQWRGNAKGPEGTAPYREKIPALLAALTATPGASLAAFSSVMCDGNDGRAATFVGLHRQLTAFLQGFYEYGRPAWAQQWVDRARSRRGYASVDSMLTDRSNFTTLRRRLNPPADGEGLAAMAARFFEGVGKGAEALEAHTVADSADEFDAARYRAALAAETAAGRKEAAFARRRLLARASPPETNPQTSGAAPAVDVEPEKPDAGSLAPLLAAAATALDATAKAAVDAVKGGRPRTARALRAEHDRIAALVGRPLLGDAGLDAAPALAQGARHGAPDCPPPINPLAGGVVEERWSAQDDGVVRGLYVLPSPGELEIGRRSNGPVATGNDRAATWIGAAVRTVDSFTGTYTVRARVRPLGAYVDGRLIVGWTRVDRGVEFAFEAGDRTSALRSGESRDGMSGVEASLSDLRVMDPYTTTLSRHVGLSEGQEAQEGRAGFDVAVHVTGPYVRVEVDGHDVLSLRRVTGEPVEGPIGFVIDRGRTIFTDVRVERHRVLSHDAACRCDRFDAPLDVAVPARFSWTSLVGRRVVGLSPSAHVRLLLWSTGFTAGDPTGATSVEEAMSTCATRFAQFSYPVDVHLAVKGEAGADGGFGLPKEFPAASALKLLPERIHAHHGAPGLDSDVERLPQTYKLGWPGWAGVFVDPAGIARSRGPIDDVEEGLNLGWFVEGR